MARRVVSVLRGPSGAPRSTDAALEANAFAVAEDVDLVLVLRGRGAELALQQADGAPVQLAGRPLPDPAAAADLRGLVESGVAVYIGAGCLAELGLAGDDLVDGVRVADDAVIADLLHDADAILAW